MSHAAAAECRNFLTFDFLSYKVDSDHRMCYRFWKLLHWHTVRKVCNGVITVALQLCCRTTLWNVGVGRKLVIAVTANITWRIKIFFGQCERSHDLCAPWWNLIMNILYSSHHFCCCRISIITFGVQNVHFSPASTQDCTARANFLTCVPRQCSWVTRFRSLMSACCKFSWKCASDRSLKIDQYFGKVLTKTHCPAFLSHGV